MRRTLGAQRQERNSTLEKMMPKFLMPELRMRSTRTILAPLFVSPAREL
jgi:hypothetical protein